LGASIIEKHVTLDRNGGGPDDSFSLEEEGLKELCVGTKAAWQSLGKVDYGMKSSEQGNVKFRRSIYAIKDIKKGEQFTKENIRSIRPGFGLEPKYYEQVLGKIAKCDIKRGTPTSFDLIL
jgi:N-acetylneuraminate synthase